MRRYQKPADLKSALSLWGSGYVLCLIVATVVRLLNDQANKPTKVIAISLIGLYVVSLVLVISSTVTIFLRLRTVFSDTDLTPDQRQIVAFALCSLLAAVFVLFITAGAFGGVMALGVISLIRSYKQENKYLSNIKMYRAICAVTIAAVVLVIFIRPLVIAALQ